MALLDFIKEKATKIIPQKNEGPPVAIASSTAGGGIAFDDELPMSKPAIAFHALQVAFAFLAMCCFASVASFQAHYQVGPSALSGFAVFCSVTNMFLALFLVLVPVIYDKYNKLMSIARALREQRVAFIAIGIGLAEVFLVSFIGTVSAWTEPGCKNSANDPNAKAAGKQFVAELSSWCRTKKAGCIFFWLGTVFWLASFILVILDWRHGRPVGGRSVRPRDPPFLRPTHDDAESVISREPSYAGAGRYGRGRGDDDDDDDDGNSNLQSPFADPRSYGAPGAASAPGSRGGEGRASMDMYGAFSDPAPSGYGAGTGPKAPYHPPRSPPQYTSTAQPAGGGLSRTMAMAYDNTGTTDASAPDSEYDDPYDRVRAAVNSGRPPAGAAPKYDYRLS